MLGVFALARATTGISGIGNAPAAIGALRAIALVATVVVVLIALGADPTPAADVPQRVPAGWHRRSQLVTIVQWAVIGPAVVILVATGKAMLILAAV